MPAAFDLSAADARAAGADGRVEIIRPDGRVERPDRRRGGAGFRPYTPADGAGALGPDDRRGRRRAGLDASRGRRVDLAL